MFEFECSIFIFFMISQEWFGTRLHGNLIEPFKFDTPAWLLLDAGGSQLGEF